MFSSCFSAPDHYRGDLSDAMDRSQDDWEGSREIPDDDDDWWNDDDDDWLDDDDDYWDDNNDYWDDEDRDEYSEPIDLAPLDLTYMLRSGSSLTAGPYFNSSTDVEALVGYEDAHWALYGFAGVKILQANPRHSIVESIKPEPFYLYAGGELRYYLMEDWKYMSPYGLLRVGGHSLFWNYQNAVTDDGDTISSDSISGLEVGLGAGIEVLRTDHLFLGVQIIPDAYLFSPYTMRGFNNNYFIAPYGETRWTVEVGIR